MCALAVSAALAGSPALAEERLPEIVVTAPPLRDDTPAPRDPTAFASVIETREAATSIETLADALSETVGVQVRRFGGLGDFSTVSVRGFSPGQVQVYLDGVPLSRGDSDVVNLSDLPLDAIDHVEVYRGMTPLAFAQSGPGGVVNIVTRKPGAAPLLGASAGYGSFGTRKATLAAGGTKGAFDGLVFAQYLGSQGGFPYTNTGEIPGTTDDRRQFRINNAFDQGDLTARLVYRAAPFSVAFTSDSFLKSQGVPGRETLQSPSGHRDTLRQVANLELSVAPTAPRPIGVDANVFGIHQEETFTATAATDDVFGESDLDNVSTTVGGQVVARGAIGAHHVPGVLVASNVERFEQTDEIGNPGLRPGTSPVRTRTRLSLAAEDEILLFGDRVSLVPGVRWELVRDAFPGDDRVRVPTERTSGTRSEDFLTPRLGARAEVGYGFTLLGNAGRSARIPNLSEVFGNNGTVRGNPNLRPETATTWDAGFRFRSPWTGAVLSAAALEYAYFASDVDDIILLIPSSVNTFTPMNIARATIRGHEVAIRTTWFDRVLFTANYTRQDAIDDSDDVIYRGNRLVGRPAHEAYVRLELLWSPARPLPLGGLGRRLWPGRVFYDANLIAENFLNRSNLDVVGSRTLHGAGIDVTIPWGDVRVAFEVKNFTDDQTSDAAGFPLPGRSMFLTASYGFGAPGSRGAREARDAHRSTAP